MESHATSGFKMGWLMVFFDLPVTTRQNRRAYTRFRKQLIVDGFFMVQYSVYARPCYSVTKIKTHTRRVRRIVPRGGAVRILTVTDVQWERMVCIHNAKSVEAEEMPEQLLLF